MTTEMTTTGMTTEMTTICHAQGVGVRVSAMERYIEVSW